MQAAESAEAMESAEMTAEVMDDSPSNLLAVTDYSDKSFVVHGELTRKYKDNLKALGGRFNKNLTHNGKNLTGWVFGLKNKEKVMEFVMSVNTDNESSSESLPNMNDIGQPTIDVLSASSATNTSVYQFVKFKIYRPREGQKVRLNTGGKTVHGTVTKTESHNNDGVIDTVHISFDGKTSLGVICRSKWQIFGYFADHVLFFTD